MSDSLFISRTRSLITPLDCSAGNPLNRLSYLRSSPAFLASALRSPKAEFLVLDNLQPLCEKEQEASRRFVRLGWNQVEQYIGDAEKVFVGVDGKNEDVVADLAAIGHEGNKTVGELSHDEKRAYFLNKVRLPSTSLLPLSFKQSDLSISHSLRSFSSESTNDRHLSRQSLSLSASPPTHRPSNLILLTEFLSGPSTFQNCRISKRNYSQKRREESSSNCELDLKSFRTMKLVSVPKQEVSSIGTLETK